MKEVKKQQTSKAKKHDYAYYSLKAISHGLKFSAQTLRACERRAEYRIRYPASVMQQKGKDEQYNDACKMSRLDGIVE